MAHTGRALCGSKGADRVQMWLRRVVIQPKGLLCLVSSCAIIVCSRLRAACTVVLLCPCLPDWGAWHRRNRALYIVSVMWLYLLMVKMS